MDLRSESSKTYLQMARANSVRLERYRIATSACQTFANQPLLASCSVDNEISSIVARFKNNFLQ